MKSTRTSGPAAMAPARRRLVGREAELAAAAGAFAACRAGCGGVLLVAGEPGVGKTQLVEHAAADAGAAGVVIFWGRTREEGGAPAYWPWVQVIRAMARRPELVPSFDALGSSLSYLTLAVPDIAQHIRGRKAAVTSTTDQFAFFDAVALLLAHASRVSPLAIVLDDLHAADRSSLAVLDFVAPQVEELAVLLVATYREHEAKESDAARVIARISRRAHHLFLKGLTSDGVEELISRTIGQPAAPEVAAAIHRTTEGNPLFVQEIAKGLRDSGQLQAGAETLLGLLPASVEHVLADRLAALSSETTEVLSLGAVIGRSFDIGLLGAVAALEPREILRRMDAAVAAGIVTVGGAIRAAIDFNHAVYREFFYSLLSPRQRAESHERIAVQLEERDVEDAAADIAHHWIEAAALGNVAKIIESSRRAGDRAMSRVAFAQATRHYQDALEAIESVPRQHAARCDLLLGLGAASFGAGEGERSKDAYRQAAKFAAACGDGQRLARASLGVAGPWTINGGAARDEVAVLLQQAIDLLDDAQPALRATLLARLAIETHHAEAMAGTSALCDEAMRYAEQSDDPEALVEVMLARSFLLYTMSSLSTLKERKLLSSAALRLARKARNADLEFRVRFNILIECLQSGDSGRLAREITLVDGLADRLRLPFYGWFVLVWRAVVAIIQGRLSDAEQLAEAALATGKAQQGREEAAFFAVQVYDSQMWTLLRDRGAGLGPLLLRFQQMSEAIGLPVLRCVLASLYCDLGRLGEARDEFERLAANDFGDIDHETFTLNAFAILCEVSVALQDIRRTALLYPRLLPHEGAHLSNGALYLGPISHYLGIAAALLGRKAEARARLEAAVQLERRLGARGWIVRTQFELARLLIDDGERDAGLSMAQEAMERARAIGMKGMEERLTPLLQPQAAPVVTSRNVWRREGEYWTVVFGVERFRLRDALGVRYIGTLLGAPNRELHVAELVRVGRADFDASRPPGVDTGRETGDLGDAGPQLDAQATRTYRSRLATLKEALAEAEQMNDLGQSSALAHEIEFLTGELVAGRRGRKSGSHAERARQAVTKAIKATLDNIRKHHPLLHRHLSATIRRGYFCSYNPDLRHPTDWET